MGMGSRKDLEEGGQKAQLPIIRYVSTGDVMYKRMTIVNTAVWCIGSSQEKNWGVTIRSDGH